MMIQNTFIVIIRVGRGQRMLLPYYETILDTQRCLGDRQSSVLIRLKIPIVDDDSASTG